MKTPRLLTIAILLLSSFFLCDAWLTSQTAVFAQTSPRFDHRTTQDGLPVNETTAVSQDNHGFIWIGSQDGISRYDGYTFTTYKHDPDNANSLSNNNISAIHQARDGFIWIATQGGGVNRFDPQTEQFRRYQHDPQEPNSLGGNVIFSIFEASNGEMWFGGPPASGLNRFDPQTEQFTRYVPQLLGGNFPGGGVWQMVEDSAGDLWLAADSALVKFEPAMDTFTAYNPSPDERRLSAVILDENGRLWTGGSTGLYQFDPQTEQFTAYPDVLGVKVMTQAADGRFWIGSIRNGVYLFDPRTEQIVDNYRHDPFDHFSLSGDNVTAVFQDDGGVIWLGTSNAGLNLFDPRQTRFGRYRHNPADENSLASSSVTAVSEQNGRLWLGTGGILNEIASDGAITRHPIADGSTIYAITPDSDGSLWLGMSNSQLVHFESQTGAFEVVSLSETGDDSRPRPPMETVAIVEDDSGALWIAITRDGLYRLDPRHEEVKAYQSLGGDGLFNPGGITALQKDSDGHIWIGYQDGVLRRLDPITETFTNYLPDPANPAALPGGSIEAIFADSDEIIWLATHTGLVHFDPLSETFRRYTDTDGLPTSFLVGIVQGRDGNLWISSKNGITQFDPAQETIRNYDVADGLQGESFNRAAATMGEDGRLYFGGSDGLTAFYPEQIKESQYQPTVILTDLRLFNETVPVGDDSLLSQPIHLAENLTLNHSQSVVSFEFAALSYAASAQNQYRYRLDGLETAWNAVESDRRFVTYTNLPAGDYVFRVQGSNSDGVWSEDEAALVVTVTPYWWELTWVQATAVFFILALLFAIYRARLLVIQRRNQQLERLVAERSDELVIRERQIAVMQEREHIGRELHDDLGQMIGYMSVQAQTAQDLLAQGQTDETNAALAQLVTASHEAHSSVRQTILGIRHGAQSSTSADFFAALQQYLADLRQQHGLDVQISLPDDLLVSPLSPEAEAQLLRIIQEALTNVRKHAKTTTAQLIFTLHANEIQTVITDAGGGFEQVTDVSQTAVTDDMPHFGLTIMRERAESVGGSIEIQSAAGMGTKVIVRLPRLSPPMSTETMEGVRVLLVDDHALYREGLRNLLQTRGAEVVGMAENGRVAQTLAAELHPNLILMDVEMPLCDGLEATRHIKAAHPDIKIVMLTVAAEEEKLFEALRAGASGYLLKSLDAALFFNMLTEVLRGETVLSPALAARVLADFAQQETIPDPSSQTSDPPSPTLTARQREVLDLVAQNKTNKEIGAALHISERTVKYHIGQVLGRLQMQNRYQLADYARQQK